jgi:hypothetical protein
LGAAGRFLNLAIPPIENKKVTTLFGRRDFELEKDTEGLTLTSQQAHFEKG